MAFTRKPTKTPTAIGNVSIVLKDWPSRAAGLEPAVAAGQSAHFAVVVVFDDGSVEQVRGNLVPHLTAGQITTIQGFLATLRAKAAAELL